MSAPTPFMGVKARRASSADKQFLGDYLNTNSNVHLQKALQKTGKLNNNPSFWSFERNINIQ